MSATTTIPTTPAASQTMGLMFIRFGGPSSPQDCSEHFSANGAGGEAVRFCGRRRIARWKFAQEFARYSCPLRAETAPRFRYTVRPRRGTQVGRERSAKPSFVGSIPTRASIITMECDLQEDRKRVV